jgi:heavy metal translocating P-type ATPase
MAEAQVSSRVPARLKPSAFPLQRVLIAVPAAGLILGFAVRAMGQAPWSAWVWGAATVPVLLALVVEISSALRRDELGLDIVAALSMTAALAVGEALAAAIVAMMYAGGKYLESFADSRARREMTALLARVPRTALRHRNGALEQVALAAIVAGDRLVVRRGDVVPVDGTVAAGVAVLDQSALTGESLPVELSAGAAVMSGSTNAGDAFDMTAARGAAESTYAGIVRLVEAAQRAKAPMARLADRYAMFFLTVTVVMAAAAWWFTGNPIRAVAVLVVATPCPLILAVPVAIVSGLSRAAKHGVLIKGGKALEALARIRSLVIDKTGTLTHGRARVVAVEAAPGFAPDEVMRIAASLDQASKHVIAQTLVAEAHKRRLRLTVPTDVVEQPGEGIEGVVEGRRAIVGGLSFVLARLEHDPEKWVPVFGKRSCYNNNPKRDDDSKKSHPAWAGRDDALRRPRTPGAVVAAVAIDGTLAGQFVLSDELRTETSGMLRDLRRLGLERIVVATGDRREVAETVTAGLPIDAVRADLTPDQKVMVVLSERKHGPVMMAGDGVNDAPALAAADVGLALGASGAAASAEAADVVLLVDQLDRVVTGIKIAQRSRFIALESVIAGIGLSLAGMLAAAFGHITPVEGALLQEAIDVAVILNALRALGEPRLKAR